MGASKLVLYILYIAPWSSLCDVCYGRFCTAWGHVYSTYNVSYALPQRHMILLLGLCPLCTHLESKQRLCTVKTHMHNMCIMSLPHEGIRPCDAKRKKMGSSGQLFRLVYKGYQEACGSELMRFIPTRLYHRCVLPMPIHSWFVYMCVHVYTHTQPDQLISLATM